MNIEKHLILLKGEDKTEDIKYCKCENGKWQVQFGNNKTFYYNYSNVQWLKDPNSLPEATTVVYHNKQALSQVYKILDFGEYVRICFESGYRKVYGKNELSIEQSVLVNPDAQNVFAYLKRLAEIVSVSDEDESTFLSRQYAKLSFVKPNSVLAKYLIPTPLNSPKTKHVPIFPFGFNLSQKDAAEKALNEQISIIEGPPGTGKTQTILNIIANAVMNGKTVAVVSNNNSATANVLEKLQKYGVDFIAAYLGNKANKDKFFADQTLNYPDMTTWAKDATSFREVKKRLDESGTKLIEMLEAKNEVALLKQELSALLVEKEHFKNYHKESNQEIEPYRSLYRQSSKTVIALWHDYRRAAEQNKVIKLTFKLKNLWRYGIYSFSFYRHSTEKVIALFQKLYYELKEQELNAQILDLTKRLESYQFDNALKKYSEDSMTLFKAKLAERFSHTKKRPFFVPILLWKDFGSFIKEYPVILSTTHSLRNCASENYVFDYVIMDEASQIDIVTGGLALSCARNAVIVGDLKQLPNVVPTKTAEETTQIFERFSLNPAYHYAENSMLSSMTMLFKDIPRTLLKEHYRCHPKIISFCNQKFYNNELIVLTEENERKQPLVVYKTAKGNHARGTYNQRQIDVILEEVLPDQIKSDSNQSVGIVSPYRMQTDKLKVAVGKREIEVDTIHKYQGREKDVIVLTTVVNEVNEFVDNPNLINVAVSRAVDKLVVVVSDNEKNNHSNIGDLVRYIEYNNFEVINSNIYSVFDLLYHSYSEQLLTSMQGRKKVSEHESENLMNAVIEKVLRLPEFGSLDRVMHQPLNMLIRNLEKLDDDESRFVMNVLTHTDFVIFNKLDKMPVLVVEVDGYAFHANNPRQLERDKMKDRILQKYGIPILRISTNESGEEARLRKNLLKILNLG